MNKRGMTPVGGSGRGGGGGRVTRVEWPGITNGHPRPLADDVLINIRSSGGSRCRRRYKSDYDSAGLSVITIIIVQCMTASQGGPIQALDVCVSTGAQYLLERRVSGTDHIGTASRAKMSKP